MLASSISRYQSDHITLHLWLHLYSEFKLAIANPLLPHLLFLETLADCAICMDYTPGTEKRLPPLSSIYASSRQTSQQHPNMQCFLWTLSALLCFSKRSSTESRNIRSTIFVSSSGSFPVACSNITNVLAVKDNVCLGEILQLIFLQTALFVSYTFCFNELILNFNSLLSESLKLIKITQIYPLPKPYENLIFKQKQYSLKFCKFILFLSVLCLQLQYFSECCLFLDHSMSR